MDAAAGDDAEGRAAYNMGAFCEGTPSAEDIRSTRQLVSTGQVVGIQVLDHIIIGGHRPHPAPYISLREAGLVDFS